MPRMMMPKSDGHACKKDTFYLKRTHSITKMRQDCYAACGTDGGGGGGGGEGGEGVLYCVPGCGRQKSPDAELKGTHTEQKSPETVTEWSALQLRGGSDVEAQTETLDVKDSPDNDGSLSVSLSLSLCLSLSLSSLSSLSLSLSLSLYTHTHTHIHTLYIH
jgi:hypothetical protein